LAICAVTYAANTPSERNTALDVVLEYSKSPSFKVRAQSAMVLGTLKEDNGVVLKALVRLLYDKHRVVRAAAVLAVGKFGDVRAISALSDVLHDEDIRVMRFAEQTTAKLVRLFRIRRPKFSTRRWAFRIRHMGSDAQFKDHIMNALLAYDRIDVGDVVPFDESNASAHWPVELELRGKFLSMSSKRLKMRMVLAFRHGGHVIKTWQSIQVRGDSKEALLKNAANTAVGKVLTYLEAR